jgi:hypothetical protein
MNIDLTFTISILNYWVRLTFVEASLENTPTPWYIIRFGGINFDWEDDLMGTMGWNLFYFHNSPHLFQIDLFFINLYTKFK